MKHTWLISAAAFALVAGSALAADPTTTSHNHMPTPGGSAGGPAAGDMPPPGEAGPGGPGGEHHHWTLAEARKHAHDWADKVDKMSEKDWEEHEAKREAFFQKMHNMTPEQRAAFRKEMHDKRAQKQGSLSPADARSPASASPSAGGNAPAPAGAAQ